MAVTVTVCGRQRMVPPPWTYIFLLKWRSKPARSCRRRNDLRRRDGCREARRLQGPRRDAPQRRPVDRRQRRRWRSDQWRMAERIWVMRRVVRTRRDGVRDALQQFVRRRTPTSLLAAHLHLDYAVIFRSSVTVDELRVSVCMMALSAIETWASLSLSNTYWPPVTTC